MSEPRIAAQLYTLRDYLKTPDDIRANLPRVAALGYRAVQLSAVGPMPDDELRAACDANGLEIAATHVGLDAILNDTAAVVAQHAAYGCRHVAVGGIQGEQTADGYRRRAAQCSAAAEKLWAAGLTFSYHNHNHELERFDGVPGLKMMIDESVDAACFEIDTYWIQAGGGDPAAWIELVAGRCPVLHYKDMAVVGRDQKFAPVGEGNLNWERINSAARQANAEWVIVEQDRCEVPPTDPFEALGVSFRNLVAMGFRP